MPRLHLIALEPSHEPFALRAAAEAWGIAVEVTWAGSAVQVVEAFTRGIDHDLLVISGHGDARGFILPTVDPAVETPFRERLTPADLASFVGFGVPGRITVVSSCCCTGRSEIAAPFLAGGARCFLGPADFPDGSATLMYLLDLTYRLLVLGQDPVTANQSAAGFADDRGMFRAFTPEWPNPTGSR